MKYEANVWQYTPGASSEALAHYASPYYDPVKAHEYYMRTRQLKGRKSTAGLSSGQRETAAYVKYQLDEERKGKAEALRSDADASANQYKTEMQREIATLRAKFKGMSKEERAENRGAIQKEIKRLRSLNAMRRNAIMAQYRSDATGLAEDYDEKYISELEKIRSESALSSASKSASKRTSSGSGTSNSSNNRTKATTKTQQRKWSVTRRAHEQKIANETGKRRILYTTENKKLKV